jgi:hypothetical protein
MRGSSPVSDGGTRRPAARVSANRIVGLALLSFAIAVVVHLVIKLLGGGDSWLRFFVTPIIGMAVMYLGLGGYPTAMRIRMTLMVGICLVLFSGAA